MQRYHISYEEKGRILDMRENLVYEYLDTNMLYRVAKDINGQFMPVATTGASHLIKTSSSDVVTNTLDIETSPDTAFQVYAIGMASFFGTSDIDTGTSSGGLTTDINLESNVTYYQPSPPASNNTTLASTTGNLRFRNNFWQQTIAMYQQWVNLGGATTGVGIGISSQGKFHTVVLAEPITIVGEALVATATNTNTLNQAFIRQGIWVVGKYVHISTNQYVNLVALATGQAILPPSVLG